MLCFNRVFYRRVVLYLMCVKMAFMKQVVSRATFMFFASMASFAFALDAGDYLSHEHFYIGTSGYATFMDDVETTLDDSNIAANNVTEIAYKKGVGFSGALGYEPPTVRNFLSQSRFELELSYRKADIENDNVLSLIPDETLGTNTTMALMLNAYYDAENHTPITPYVGLGVGFAHVQLDDAARLGLADENDLTAAYQVMTGFIVKPKESQLSFFGGYRYFKNIQEVKFSSTGGNAIEIDNQSHNIEAGFRFHL